MLDDELTGLRQTVAALQRDLNTRTAERDEALAQQAATTQVLQVINDSPGDLAPVFDAMLEKAMRLCAAAFGVFFTYDGERFDVVGQRGLPPAFTDFLRETSWNPRAGTAALRVVHGEAFVHIADLTEDDGSRQENPVRRAMIELGGARTQLTVPLRKQNALLGMFIIYRQGRCCRFRTNRSRCCRTSPPRQ
jgi:GAF domain-containing protein